MKRIFALLLVALLATQSLGWSECGNHIIAVMAFRKLPEARRAELLEILSYHPQFETEFKVPENIKNRDEWLIGRAGYWPEVARKYPGFNRPTWHYELGASLTLGFPGEVTAPDYPGPLPSGATLNTQELYASQAFELCSRILNDPSETLQNRALALCWVLHIGADAHQPCQAGSLYLKGIFPDGDRGAKEIRIKQGQNLHEFWDGLLGGRFDEGDVNRRIEEIQVYNANLNYENWQIEQRRRFGPILGIDDSNSGNERVKRSDTSEEGIRGWLEEGRMLATSVYPGPMRRRLIELSRASIKGAKVEVPVFDLSQPEFAVSRFKDAPMNRQPYEVSYMQAAGEVAQERADWAWRRIVQVLKATPSRNADLQ